MKQPTKRGRPRTVNGGVRVTIRIPERDHARVKAITEATGATVSDAAREAIKRWVDDWSIAMSDLRVWLGFTNSHGQVEALAVGDARVMERGLVVRHEGSGEWGAFDMTQAPVSNPRVTFATPFLAAASLRGPWMRSSVRVTRAASGDAFSVTSEERRFDVRSDPARGVGGRVTVLAADAASGADEEGARANRVVARFEWLTAVNEGEPMVLLAAASPGAEAVGVPPAVIEAMLARLPNGSQ